MAAVAARPHPVGTMRRTPSRPSAAPPLIGVVTHELRAESAPGVGAGPGPPRARPRAATALAAAVLHAGAAGGGRDRGGAPRPRLRRRRRRAARPRRRPAHQRRTGPRPGALRPGSRIRSSAPTSTSSPTSTSRPCCAAPPSATCRCSASAAGCRRSTSPAAGPCTSTSPSTCRRTRAFAPAHDVEVVRGSLLHWLTDRDGLAVNSFHHQAADRIGAGLEVCRACARRDRRGALGPGRRLLPRRAMAC